MRKYVTLIANARAGRGAFDGMCERLITLLQVHGREVSVFRTTADPGSATSLAAEAARSSETVVACGGDGTVNEVLQGIAGTDCHLGILPFGTANALARNLLLPSDPVNALKKLLTYRVQKIPLGQIRTAAGTRLFTVMAGAGPDGGLVAALRATSKARYGRSAYYTTAARHLLTRRFPAFRVEYLECGSQQWQAQVATAMMISRVPNLGGGFRALTRASQLHHPYLLLQLIKGPAQLAFPAWFASAHLRLETFNPLLSSHVVTDCRCTAMDTESGIFAQADGELMGTVPATIQLADNTVRLLMPSQKPDTPSFSFSML